MITVKFKYEGYELVVDPQQLGGADAPFLFVAPGPSATEAEIKSSITMDARASKARGEDLQGYYDPATNDAPMAKTEAKINEFSQAVQAVFSGRDIRGSQVPKPSELTLALGTDINLGGNKKFYERYSKEFLSIVVDVFKKNQLLEEAAALTTVTKPDPTAAEEPAYWIPAGLVGLIRSFGGDAIIKTVFEPAYRRMNEKIGEAGGKKIPVQAGSGETKDTGAGSKEPSESSKEKLPTEPAAKATREKISGELSQVLNDLPNADEEEEEGGLLSGLIDFTKDAFKDGVVKTSNFDEGDSLYKVLDKVNNDIAAGKPVDISGSIKDSSDWQNAGKIATEANEAVLKGIQREFPERFQEFVDENPTVKDLLKIGSTEPSKLSPDNKTTYDNLKKYADFLGVGREFEQIARGERPSSTRSRGSEETEGGPRPRRRDVEGGESSGTEREKGKRKDDVAVKGTDLLAIRFVINGTYSGPDEDKSAATIKYKFTSTKDDSSSNTLTTKRSRVHDGPPSKIIWEDEFKNYDKITVTVTAYPELPDGEAGEQDSITQTYGIPVRGWPRDSFATFNFSQKVDDTGKGSGGISVSAGGRYTTDKPDVSGDIPDYFYDKKGRPRLLREIGASCSKDGRKYTFSFTSNVPLIVPIMTDSKITLDPSSVITESRSRQPVLTEAAGKSAVPHWIFITKDMKGRGGESGGGAGSGAGGGTGGGGKLGDPGPYNVAVSSFSCKTREKWAQVPQDNQAWDYGSFEFSLAAKTRVGFKDAAPLIFEGGVDEDEIFEEVRQFILGANQIWRMSGLNGLIEHRSVTGDTGITARDWNTTRSARP